METAIELHESCDEKGGCREGNISSMSGSFPYMAAILDFRFGLSFAKVEDGRGVRYLLEW